MSIYPKLDGNIDPELLGIDIPLRMPTLPASKENAAATKVGSRTVFLIPSSPFFRGAEEER